MCCRLCLCCICTLVILVVIAVFFGVGPLMNLKHHFVIKQSVDLVCEPNNIHGISARRRWMNRKPFLGYTAPPP
ncbi:hypothetical protein D8674_038903 [Pyrus ussuriensis x Pyrus communis]|uniref:Uncharacterized protein n=1 Tax=Pyrus ussuriensis x Pyrus communis TaxID=2448454 RepID=A0A5N5I4W0_9ROSA|nr:hypothetical protein D8674_038903 [Pyrus ussuriensis x Pyrus communis]